LRRLAFLLIFQVVLAGVVTPPANAQAQGRYIVVLRKHLDASATAAEHGRKYGVEKRAVYSHAINGYAATIPSESIAALRREADVVSVFPDVEAHAASQTTPTGVERIRATAQIGTGAGVEVAILDTGIDLDHPDLAANIAGGKNCSTGSSYNDSSNSGHGTHVAGIVAAADNTIGVRGVAPAAKLWAVRVLNNLGSGDYTTLLCGLDFVDSKSPAHGGSITVANMSIEASGSDDGDCGNTDGDPLHQAICQVRADGVTVVVAAGNYHEDIQDVVPAGWDEVITASALSDSDGQPCGSGPDASAGADDTFAGFSSYATTSLDRAHIMGAPGDDIYSTWNNGAYTTMSGTSMASPTIAGAAALYIATHPGSTPAAVLAGLKANGEAPNVDYQGECGGGSSHTDPSSEHPEVVVSVAASLFTITAPTTVTGPALVNFAGPVTGLDNSNLVLRLASGGATIPANVSYDAGTHVATLDPDPALVPGQYYTITVSPAGSTPPTDGNGDTIPETSQVFRAAKFEQENGVWSKYSWRTVLNNSAYGGRMEQDRTRYASEAFTFTGTSIAWYSYRGPDQGWANVTIDGVSKGSFDLYRSSPLFRVRFAWTVPAGTHTIKITPLGTKNSHSTNYWASVDAFAVGSTIYANPVVAYGWRLQKLDFASADAVYQDGSGGAAVTFRFRGTGIDWRTIRGPDQGYAKIYIDNVYKGTVDNWYSTAGVYTRAYHGLSDAEHYFKVVVAGAKRATATNTMVSVDCFTVI
jgi:subtilisin